MEFEFAGLTISEPITGVGNFLIAGVCFYAFLQTRKLKSFPGKVSWSYFFLSLALSTFIGAFSHLFSSYEILALKLSGWFFSIFTAYFAQVSAIQQLTGKPTGTFVLISKVEVVLFLIAIYFFKVFEVVLIASVVSILVAITIHAYGYLSKVMIGSEIILLGFVLCSLTAIARLLNLSVHPIWFNHHDVAHLMMVGAAMVMLWGVKRASFAFSKNTN